MVATGRRDFPNQINNVLAFPGIFRGALDAGATAITEGMKLAAADAIAGAGGRRPRARTYVVPSPFDPRVGAGRRRGGRRRRPRATASPAAEQPCSAAGLAAGRLGSGHVRRLRRPFSSDDPLSALTRG